MLTVNCWSILLTLEAVKYANANDQSACISAPSTQHRSKLFLYEDGYELNEIPVVDSGNRPFKVTIAMDVWEITDLSLEKQDVGIDLILEITWLDPRLSVNPNISSRLWHVISKEETNQLWQPTLAYRNCKGCHLIKLNPPFYMRRSDGVLWAQHRSVTRFSCPINLRAYPMDYQVCPLQLYTMSDYESLIEIDHGNMEDQQTVNSNMTLSEFIVPALKKGQCNFRDENDVDKQYFSCIEIKIHFQRLMAYHLMTTYIPTAFIVIISWISFWLPVDVVPARIALGLTLLLTLATRLDQAQKNLPPVSYAKAIDIWIFYCICMVCASLLEFAVSYYMWRINQNGDLGSNSSMCSQHCSSKTCQIRPFSTKKSTVDIVTPETIKQRDGTTLDRISRVLFPLFFLLFNTAYWAHYL